MNVLWSADEERDGVPAGRLGEDQRKNRRLTELQMEELLLAARLINRKRLQNAKKSRGPAGRRHDAGLIVQMGTNALSQMGRKK
jgi:hypothetical protein